jgi:hypothetical protein
VAHTPLRRLSITSDDRDRTKAHALLARLPSPGDRPDDSELLALHFLLEFAGAQLPYALEARVSPWREQLARRRAEVLFDLRGLTEADVEREKARIALKSSEDVGDDA